MIKDIIMRKHRLPEDVERVQIAFLNQVGV
jgi:hypothetical protein